MSRFEELKILLDASSAPYSGFNVASLVLTRSGEVFKGVNVESAAYPTTMCAERSAVFSAVSNGMKSGDVAEVHILARNRENVLIAAYPCGACRQVIAEQSNNEAKVYVYSSETECEVHPISVLLPHAFLSLDTL